MYHGLPCSASTAATEAFAETPCLPSYPRLSSPDKVLHRHLKLLQSNHVKEVTKSRHTGMNESITSKLYIVHTHNPSAREGEAAGPQVQDLLPELHRTPVCSSPPSIKKRKWGDRDPTDPGPQDQFVEEENKLYKLSSAMVYMCAHVNVCVHNK